MHCCLWPGQSLCSAWYFSLVASHLNKNLLHFCSTSLPRSRPVHFVSSVQLSLNFRLFQLSSLIYAELSGWHFPSSPSTSHLPLHDTPLLRLQPSYFSLPGIL